jgi:hypothetical protein
VFFNSIAAKGLSEDVNFALVPLTCFVGLSGGGDASCGIDLKLLSNVSCCICIRTKEHILLWQLFWVQQPLKLAYSVAEVSSSGAAGDLVV